MCFMQLKYKKLRAQKLPNIEISDLVRRYCQARSIVQWVISSRGKENHTTTRVPCTCYSRRTLKHAQSSREACWDRVDVLKIAV